jgi:hypothetical protein
MIPANPKTYVVTITPGASEGFLKEPIIAWIPHEKADTAMPQPLTGNGVHRVIAGSAILFPCGMVTDPTTGFTYETVEAWLEGGAKPPKTAKAKAAAEPEPDDEQGEGALDIEWTTSAFKNKSFWRYDDGEYEFVFQVDGGENAPKASTKLTKIKRDDFAELKKTIDVMTVDQIKNYAPIPDAEEPDAEDEDDEDDDLI